MTEQARFVVLGSGGIFTFHVIKTLLDHSFLPLAFIQSGHQQIQKPSKFENIELHIPQRGNELHKVLNVHSITMYCESGIDLPALIHELDIEYLLVACWPRLIPQSIITSVSRAALNLHPSLLPRYRGYDPIGEQLTRKDHNFGITLHLLNQQFDQGDIVLQKGFKIDNHPAAENINREAAIRGAELFIRAVNTHEYPGWFLKPQLM